MSDKLAIVFPGQGSQSVGMLADIAQTYGQVKTYYEEASDVLHYDLWALVQSGPASELDKTQHTQPALLVGSYALYQILQTQLTKPPQYFAGHSLGEYTALLCAGALSFANAVKLVAARGEFMQQAVAAGQGAMAAIIGLDEQVVSDICAQAIRGTTEVLSPANYNSIGQVVIAGHASAIERAIKLAKVKGAKMAITIPVSVPSHCDLMLPAVKQLAPLLLETNFQLPTIPVINNVNVMPYNSIDMIRTGLAQQLFSPVRWVETIQFFVHEGVKQIIECGPGKILTGLNKRIDKHLQLQTAQDLLAVAL